MKKYIAECIGTFVLTLLGCGTAMFLGCNTPAGVVGTAIAFGLTVMPDGAGRISPSEENGRWQ